MGKSIKKRTKQELIKKMNTRTIPDDKRERKKQLQECDSETIKGIIKIRLYMRHVNCNYKRGNTDTKCPLCKKSEDTTEYVLECEKANKFTISKEESKGEWEEITEIYGKNKKMRQVTVIQVQGQNKIIKQKRKKKVKN